MKKALRAMVRPVQEVAALIEEQDAKGLAALPGIGPATAERIIAKLRRKVPKFALLVGRDLPAGVATERDVLSEAFEALRALGHSESDARRLLDDALARKKKYKDVDELLRAVYDSGTAAKLTLRPAQFESRRQSESQGHEVTTVPAIAVCTPPAYFAAFRG